MFLFCFQYTLMTKHCRWKPVGKKTEFSMKSRSLSPCYYTKGALTHHLVVASSTSFARPQAAGLIRSAAPPLPTKLRFAGTLSAVVSLLPVGNVRSPRELRFLREAAGCGLRACAAAHAFRRDELAGQYRASSTLLLPTQVLFGSGGGHSPQETKQWR